MEVQSPAWWVDRLNLKLSIRMANMRRWDRYYRGEHDLPDVRDDLRDNYRRQLQTSNINFMRLVVDAAEERLNVEGFRFSDAQADDEAWRIWQSNLLDAESGLGHREALVKSIAYAIVWEGEDPRTPSITIEDGMSVVVEHEPGNRRKRAAALKVWHDDWTDRKNATLYLPDGIYKFGQSGSGSWDAREVDGEVWPLPNPLGVVPVVPLPNRPNLHGEGESEIADVIASQDRINKILFDRMMAAEFTSFRQRWATGVDIPTHPETGEPVEPFEMAVQRLLVNENPEGRFGEFGQTDLKPYIEAAEQDLKFIAAATHTPPHYLNTSADRLSGESIKAAETGLVAKVKRKQRHFGEAWEEVMRLSFAVLNDPRRNDIRAETIWADPESRTESEHADAIGKVMESLQLPQRAGWEMWGLSPTEITRYSRMAAQQGLTSRGIDLEQMFDEGEAA